MKSILIIEDDLEIREVLKEILSVSSYDVQTVSNGKLALEHLQQAMKLPDLILLDLMMPVMNGWEFSKEIQKDPKLSRIPVILLSAFNEQVKDIPCIAFVKKPISDLTQFLKVIHDAKPNP